MLRRKEKAQQGNWNCQAELCVSSWPGSSDVQSATFAKMEVVGWSPTPANPSYQSPDGSANFHRGELSTQHKATRLSRRIVRLFCVGFNRRVHDGLPQLRASN